MIHELLPATAHSGGEQIKLRGTATDPEDGTLSAAASPGGSTSDHQDRRHHLPQDSAAAHRRVHGAHHGKVADAWFRIHLRVRNGDGYDTTVPRGGSATTADITLASDVPGIKLCLDQPVGAPYTTTGVTGVVRALGAPSPQSLMAGPTGSCCCMVGVSHSVSTPAAATTYTASYRQLLVPGGPVFPHPGAGGGPGSGGGPDRLELDDFRIARRAFVVQGSIRYNGSPAGERRGSPSSASTWSLVLEGRGVGGGQAA